MFVFNKPPSTEGEENSLSASLNWFFSTKKGELQLDYYGYYIPERFAFDTEGVFGGTPKTRGHLIGSFTASQDKIVAIEVDPRNCIRVLYPGADEIDPHLTELQRFVAKYSNPIPTRKGIQPGAEDALQRMFGEPLVENWCAIYQQADFLHQYGYWQEITKLAEKINPLEYQKDWQKLTVFIEAYAQTGQNEQAAELLRDLHQFPPAEKKVYCEITQNWMDALQPDGDFLTELNAGRKLFKCK
jgi:hypothetical protein